MRGGLGSRHNGPYTISFEEAAKFARKFPFAIKYPHGHVTGSDPAADDGTDPTVLQLRILRWSEAYNDKSWSQSSIHTKEELHRGPPEKT